MYVLECGKYNHIVDWKLDTESNETHFIVYDIDAFTKTVLPTFFKVAKYDSFQRKLYRWGFIKTRRTRAEKLQLPKSACYVHPFFRQGDYNGAAQMTCSGANVEYCKTEQKKRKRQQREKGSKVSKKTHVSNSNVKKTTEQKSITTMMPSLGNFQPLMAHDPFCGAGMMEAIPSLLPTSTMIRMNGCERIEDSTTLPVLSRDSSTLKSQLSSSSRNTPNDDDDISKLLARAKAQRQLQRIQLNNLMREKLLKEMQEDSFFDETGMHLSSPSPNDDFSSSALNDQTQVAVDAGSSSVTKVSFSSSDSCSSNQFGFMTSNNCTLNNSGFVGDNNDSNLPFNPVHQFQQQGKQASSSLFQYQDTLMKTVRSDSSNGADYRQKRREVHQRIINDAFNVLKL